MDKGGWTMSNVSTTDMNEAWLLMIRGVTVVTAKLAPSD